jgi:hypothetical protein
MKAENSSFLKQKLENNNSHLVFYGGTSNDEHSTRSRHSMRAFKAPLKRALVAIRRGRNEKVHVRGVEKYRSDSYKNFEDGTNVVIERLPELSAAIVYGLPDYDAKALVDLGFDVFPADSPLNVKTSECGPDSLDPHADVRAGEAGLNLTERDDQNCWHLVHTRTRTIESRFGAKSGRQACVAIIDTQVNRDHEEFAGASIDFVPRELMDSGDPEYQSASESPEHGTAMASLVVGARTGVSPRSHLIVCPSSL